MAERLTRLTSPAYGAALARRAMVAMGRAEATDGDLVTFSPAGLASDSPTLLTVGKEKHEIQKPTTVRINHQTTVQVAEVTGGGFFSVVRNDDQTRYVGVLHTPQGTRSMEPATGLLTSDNVYLMQKVEAASEECGTREGTTAPKITEAQLAHAEQRAKEYDSHPDAVLSGVSNRHIIDLGVYVTPQVLQATQRRILGYIAIGVANLNKAMTDSGLQGAMVYQLPFKELAINEDQEPDPLLDTFIRGQAGKLTIAAHGDLNMLFTNNWRGTVVGYSEIGGLYGIVRRAGAQNGTTIGHELEHMFGGLHPAETPGINHGVRRPGKDGSILAIMQAGEVRRLILSGAPGYKAPNADMVSYLRQQLPTIAAYGGSSPYYRYAENNLYLPLVQRGQ